MGRAWAGAGVGPRSGRGEDGVLGEGGAGAGAGAWADAELGLEFSCVVLPGMWS